MGMSTGSGEGGFVADINVTPMVDVMLVLLIIFMIITPMLQSGVTVTLPETKNPDLDTNINKESAVVIAVPVDGQFWIGKERVQQADIPDRVKQMLKDKPPQEQVVYIKSGENVKYGTVVSVIDGVRDAGFERIGLVSKREKGPENENPSASPSASPAK